MSREGHVFQINRSAGGVPKQPVGEGVVGPLGLEGDRQRDTRHHGGPDRALCLYSLDCILALQREGHPIFPGAVGENITIAGLSWDVIRSGLVLTLGPFVRVAVTGFASPCRTIRRAFADEEFTRIAAPRYPGWARAYARVLEGGRIRVGDAVRLE